jgi:hypothetical protein
VTEVKRYEYHGEDERQMLFGMEYVCADDYDALVIEFNELVAQVDRHIVAGQDDKARIAQLEALVRRFVAFDPYPDSTLTKDARSALAPPEQAQGRDDL